MDSDWILIFKMKQGSDAAWAQFIRKYYGDILKYCFFHCPDRDSAEDLTQEVFLKFFSALAGYQHVGKAKHYLYTIAGNLCRDQAARKRELLWETGELAAEPADPLEDRLALEGALRRLPEEFREVILLHYYQDLKLTEIAAVLGIGLPLVKYRLKRGKELLRKEFDDGSE